MSLGVDLEDDRFPGHILGRARHFRRRRAAGTAPRRPEVHQHGNGRVFDDVVEENRIRRERFRDRGKLRFTRAATACVG